MIGNKSRQSGFTLIEVMVSSLVFSVIVLTFTGLYVQILSNQRRAFAYQKIQENGLYILELMSREIRVSTIENQDSPNCTATSLTVTHPVNGLITYSVVSGVLKRTAGGVTAELSTSDIRFNRINFCIIGSSPTDQKQARVAIVTEIQNKIGRDIFSVDLQTTVTSRDVLSEFTR
jgi:prepilin-type N-terminal cleavage/methylation domain-containing protein